ncbi:MAG TPA: hypothetical protein VD905_08095 [Flavobacteriales bacterium]|nr:hypothetical protein [Flavobacteriales bacterium]
MGTSFIEQHQIDLAFNQHVKSIQEIRIGIDRLKAVDFSGLKFPQIKELYFSSLGLLPIVGLPFDLKIFDSLSVFRGRDKRTLKKGENICKVRSFSYPKQSMNYGRAHIPGYPVFYGADSVNTVFCEMKGAKPNDEFYIARWNFDISKLNVDQITLNVLLSGNTSKENPWGMALAKARLPYDDDYTITEENKKALVYLNEEVCRLFVEKGDKFYPLTSFIAHKQLYAADKTTRRLIFPFLIYPSVEDGGDSCNFAVHPKFVDDFLRLKTIYHVKLLEWTDSGPKVEIIKMGYSNDNENILWFKMQEDLHKRSYRLNRIECPTCKREFFGEDLKDLRIYNHETSYSSIEFAKKIISIENPSFLEDIPSKIIQNLRLPKNLKQEFHWENADKVYLLCGEEPHYAPKLVVDLIQEYNYIPVTES